MERRRLLRAAAGVGVAGALGTAAVVASRPSLPPARYLGDAVPRPDGAPVVAADHTERGDHPEGLVWQDATVYDLGENRFRLVTRCVLIPGENQYGTNWKTAGLTVEHDWSAADATVESRSADVVPAKRGEARSSLGLETGRGDRARRWRLAFDSPTGNTVDYSFATTVELPGAPGAGDPLVGTSFEVEFAGGWFRSETFGAESMLSVGDESEE
ncbi:MULTISPECIES: hypothetical protein [Halorussus]|uniref:hypothetical protein n=1 Tax=Halorussus TaxID=1070314 RepID=UPI00209C99D3|nr:hypothetical protein [Halorussus vallis]USZ74549.1 hypothetical protein NGM07_13990 [Halorussus vallis]